jgi:hypothetical protein
MKEHDHVLDRLFRAAARGVVETSEAPSPALTARVLAQWRSAETDDDFAPILRLMRHAVLYAGLIMMLSIAWCWPQNQQESADKTALVSYANSVELPP